MADTPQPPPDAVGTRGTDPRPDAPPTPVEVSGPLVVDVDAPVGVHNVPLMVIAVVLAILLLKYAAAVFIPVAIAILVSYTLSPSVAALERNRIPPALGAGFVLLLLLMIAGLGAYKLTSQVSEIVDQVPVAAQRVRERMRQPQGISGGVVEKVQRAAQEVDRTADAAATAPPAGSRAASAPQKVEIVQPGLSSSLWAGSMTLLGFAGQFVLVLFLVYFFLVTGDLYKRKLVKLAGPTFTEKKVTVQILDEINRQIESFVRVQLLTSVLVGFATSFALWWFGVHQYVVWGILAGVFNSIPYLGPIAVTGGLGLVTFLQFDDIGKTAVVCAVTFVITSLEGFLLTPALMSRAARINSAAIFTGLLFWTWVWGVWGTILAVPMLMMIKAVCDHIEDLQPIGELLGE
jgi:predicted PurR-regulated permease PerM